MNTQPLRTISHTQRIKKLAAGLFICISSLIPFSTSSLSADEIAMVSKEEQKSLLLPWIKDFNAGIQEAKTKKLPVYVSFTAPDWCSYCRLMEENIYSKREFTDMVQNKFVFVEIYLPRGGRTPTDVKALLQRFNIRGIPTVVILSSDGEEEIGRFGYTRMSPKAYAEQVLATVQ